jgi:hypothetical protein
VEKTPINNFIYFKTFIYWDNPANEIIPKNGSNQRMLQQSSFLKKCEKLVLLCVTTEL